MDGPFGEKLRKGIWKKDDKMGMRLTPEKLCVFLRDDKLCDIQKELGEEWLCETCNLFPRHTCVAGDILIYYLSFGCPAAAGSFLKNSEKAVINVADVSEVETESGEACLKPIYHNMMIHALTIGLEVIQNRAISVRQRLSALVMYIYQLQEHITKGESDAAVSKLFSTPEMYEQIVSDGKLSVYLYFRNILTEYMNKDLLLPLSSVLALYTIYECFVSF